MLTIQYLESPYPAATPQAARLRLRQAFETLPIDVVILGWNLPAALEDAVAEETARQHAALYRWHPLLASDTGAALPTEWRTVNHAGQPIPGFRDMPEFTFICSNQPAVQEWLAERIQAAIHRGIYQGIFLDRMRWPSPAENFPNSLGCFCPFCWKKAGEAGLDLELVSRRLEREATEAESALELTRLLFQPQGAESTLERFLQFRGQVITKTVAKARQQTLAAGLKLGLDCFSPSLMRMVGQDLAALGAHCDWAKLMIYPHVYGPAGLPYELSQLANWLVQDMRMSGQDALKYLCATSALPLPDTLTQLHHPGLPAETLTREIRRARTLIHAPLLAGLALVQMSGVHEADDAQILADLKACQQAQTDGLALSWDLWLIPQERLELLSRRQTHTENTS